ncbi:MAG TPA: glycerophosphodiester phosphodiesterase [Polyangia bacterium]|jgi:glycerophosphoryl diester phosphodiesterase
MSARGWGRATPPLLVAHRGASATEPENTVGAIRAARTAGADAVEIDVRLCRTGEVVVFHDEDLGRMAKVPMRVADLGFEALRDLDLGHRERVPTLDEILEEAGRDLLVDVEIKAETARDLGLEAKTAAILRRHDVGPRVCVSSFHPAALWRFRRQMPEVPSGIIFADDQVLPLRRAWFAPLLGVGLLAAQSTLCDPATVHAWHGRGYAVLAWTVDDPDEAAALAAAGVDALAANDPARVRGALGL